MKNEPVLNPTLWRTCRILAGPTRLALLRRLLKDPGQTVTRLATAENLRLARASQELRRLQSRGLLQAERTGAWVRYRPLPDPQVPSARPILQAVTEMFCRFPAAVDAQILATAAGLSHARRIELIRALRAGPAELARLRILVPMPSISLWRHLHELEVRGWVAHDGRRGKLAANDSPLAKCLLSLV